MYPSESPLVNANDMEDFNEICSGFTNPGTLDFDGFNTENSFGLTSSMLQSPTITTTDSMAPLSCQLSPPAPPAAALSPQLPQLLQMSPIESSQNPLLYPDNVYNQHQVYSTQIFFTQTRAK